MYKKIILFILVILLSGCFDNQIKIGLVASISEKYSSMGISVRNATELAISEYNKNRTFFDKKITLIIKDFSENSESAEEIIKSFDTMNVKIVIAQLTSSPGIKFINSANAKKMLILTSTISTDKLTGIDDLVIRTTGDTSYMGKKTSEFIIKDNVENLAIISDPVNSFYTRSIYSAIKENFNLNNKKNIYYKEIEQKSIDYYEKMTKELIKIDPDGILFIASGIDSGMMIQIMKKFDLNINYYGCSWTKTSDFITHSGRSGEGVKMVGFYEFSKENMTASYKKYYDKYTTTYNRESNFMSDYSFELAEFIIDILKKTNSDNPEKIKKMIIKKGDFEGIMGKFHIDQFGDCERPMGLSIVKNNIYQNLKLE